MSNPCGMGIYLYAVTITAAAFFCENRPIKYDYPLELHYQVWYIIISSNDMEAMNMMKREIMIRAHQIAKQCSGDRSACLAIGLRQAWLEAKLVKVGSRWQKNGMNRIYFNDLHKFYGLNIDTYKTGNISYATLDGEKISNTQAAKIQSRLMRGKLWFDCITGRFESKDVHADDFEVLVDALRIAA